MDVSRDSPAAAVPSTVSHFHAACHQQGFGAGSSERDLLHSVGSLLQQHQHDLVVLLQQQQDVIQQQQDVIHQHQEFMHEKLNRVHDELNIVKRSVLQNKAQFDVHKVTYSISMYACTLFHFACSHVTHGSLAWFGVFQGSVLQLSCRQPEAGVKRAKIHSVIDQRRGVHGMLCYHAYCIGYHALCDMLLMCSFSCSFFACASRSFDCRCVAYHSVTTKKQCTYVVRNNSAESRMPTPQTNVKTNLYHLWPRQI